MEYRFQLFSLGRIVATPTALSRIPNADIQSALCVTLTAIGAISAQQTDNSMKIL